MEIFRTSELPTVDAFSGVLSLIFFLLTLFANVCIMGPANTRAESHTSFQKGLSPPTSQFCHQALTTIILTILRQKVRERNQIGGTVTARALTETPHSDPQPPHPGTGSKSSYLCNVFKIQI